LSTANLEYVPVTSIHSMLYLSTEGSNGAVGTVNTLQCELSHCSNHANRSSFHTYNAMQR